VGEFGSAISGGEQQRIAIARALYKQPEILILDEATSALDRDTESRLVEMTNAIGQDITIIMIAHRLESLRYCRRIIRVEGGSLIEVGTYQDLVGQRAS
jgi:ABC-type bacteriocin/lantibiotic exporter with double-glycine peptidase domain